MGKEITSDSFTLVSERVPAREFRPAVPPNISDYELLRLIGSGSYGQVWLGRSATGALRAVKIVYRNSFDHERPYEREFEGIQKFEPISQARESQVAIFHVGRNDNAGFFYYVMELADPATGNQCSVISIQSAERANPPTSLSTDQLDSYQPRTLKHELKTRGALPVSECVQIGQCLAGALDHLHSHGLVHRDIKPSNIIFVNGRPKLADIGLVTSTDATRSFVGTDGYIPPEGPGTPQADLYSLGKVLYECVTGKDRTEFPELPQDWRTHPEMDQLLEFNEIIIKACAREQIARYRTAREFAQELVFLQKGYSIKRQRANSKRIALIMKIAAVVLLLAALPLASFLYRTRHRADSTSSRSIPSTNRQAMLLYDQARRIVQADDTPRYGVAWSNLTAAVQLDTNFSTAYGLMAHMAIGESWAIPIQDRVLTLRRLADRLMQLDDKLAESHFAQSYVYFLDWKFDQAEKSIREAIRLNPEYWIAHTLYGFYLCLWGHADRSRHELEIGEKLEPSFAINQFVLGLCFLLQRDYDSASKQFDESLRLNPKLPWAHANRALVFQLKDDYLSAIEELRLSQIAFSGDELEANERASQLREAFNDQGKTGFWQKTLQLEMNKPSPDPYEIACIYAEMRDRNKAIEWLKNAVPTRRSTNGETRLMLPFDQCWDFLRSDRDFKQIFAELNFPK